jgi:hypothetical protein
LTGALGRAYNILPSDLADPEHEWLDGPERIVFDGVVTAVMVQEERLASGDTEGISVEDQVRFGSRDIDVTEHEKLQELKKNLREKG